MLVHRNLLGKHHPDQCWTDSETPQILQATRKVTLRFVRAINPVTYLAVLGEDLLSFHFPENFMIGYILLAQQILDILGQS